MTEIEEILWPMRILNNFQIHFTRAADFLELQQVGAPVSDKKNCTLKLN